MKKIFIFILFASLSCGAKQGTAAEIEVPGLITDHTVTSVGHAFYRDFSDNWEKEYPGTLTISERPVRAGEVGSRLKLNRIQFIKPFYSQTNVALTKTSPWPLRA